MDDRSTRAQHYSDQAAHLRALAIKWVQTWIEFKQRTAVGAEYLVLRTHLQIDMRVVFRRRLADAFEFPCSNADSGDAAIIAELGVDLSFRRWAGYPDH